MRCSCHILGDTISIHAPRTGSDRTCSTPWSGSAIISIHAPRTGSDGEQYATTSYVDISIHAPRTGSDIIGAGTIVRPLTISIHAPRTGSDVEISDLSRGGDISIHAPRTGSDHAMFLPHTGRHYFNPRSPHGERPYLLHPMERFGNYFNPRSPHGERLCHSVKSRRLF